ncbi:MAG: tetratricopeptide repeat protein [Ferruginibacter sp.]|nr:tetratricopeptide repeat protein [Ferruginibacter sp.]
MKKIPLLIFSFIACSIGFSQKSDSSNLYFQKGMEEKNARHFLAAAKYFDKALTFNAAYKEALLENGYANLEMRKTDIAKGHFTKLYELDPTNKPAIKELTSLYFDYRQFQKAVEFALKCTGCDNTEKILAMSNYHLEDYGAAIKGLLSVLAKNPNDAEAVYTLGRSYLDMEQYKAALPWYNKAVQLDADKNVWAYELGLLYYNQNEFKNAAIFFNKAAEKGYPLSNDFAENLGYAYIYSGEFDKGEKLLLSILAKKPGNKDILRDIAEAYYGQKMYDKSLEYCQKLMELDMKDAKALYQAGLCFQKKGQKDKGQGMCDKAIEMDPSLAGMRQKNMTMGL